MWIWKIIDSHYIVWMLYDLYRKLCIYISYLFPDSFNSDWFTDWLIDVFIVKRHEKIWIRFMKIFPVPHNLLLPLTTRWAEWVTEPAGLVALHVYWPTCLWLTAEMVSMLVLLPSIVVDNSGEEEIISPFKLQVIDKGSSGGQW